MHFHLLPRHTETKNILEKRRKAARHQTMRKIREGIHNEHLAYVKIFYALMVLAVVYTTWLGIKRPIYQIIYGKRTDFDMTISRQEVFVDVGDQDIINTSIAGYDLNIKIKKIYSVTGKIVYIDRYENPIGTWFRSAASPGVVVYDAVAPLDLSVAHSEASDLPLNHFSHEYRLLWSSIVTNHDEINNNHTIPATNAIAKGLEILKPGEIAYLKGYLVDWKESKDIEYIETAIYAGEMHKKVMISGMSAGLCRQLYLTKLIFDGREFE